MRSFLLCTHLSICYSFLAPDATRNFKLNSLRDEKTVSVVENNADTTKMPEESFNVRFNAFFKEPVPESVLNYISLQKDVNFDDKNILSMVKASPSSPGVPRPLWLVVVASLPTALVWYGYYKFVIEEELMQLELEQNKTPRGFGGYGTLAPFVYGMLLGPAAALFGIPGGVNWSGLGVAFIYYTQFLLYDRVNELYREEGLDEPLTVWWCWPIFFPLNLVVGLRQVHFLSQYWYRKSNMENTSDPFVAFFPFIGAPKLTWQQLFLTPSLWCTLLASVSDIDPLTLPEPLQEFLKLDAKAKTED